MIQFSAMANKIREERESTAKRIYDDKKAHYDGIISRLESEFEAGFADYLHILHEDGIKYSLHLQNKEYEHMGTYILFEKDGKQLKMDFYNKESYRYEYNQHTNLNGCNSARSVYGKWPKEDFVLFIADGLFKE